MSLDEKFLLLLSVNNSFISPFPVSGILYALNYQMKRGYFSGCPAAGFFNIPTYYIICLEVILEILLKICYTYMIEKYSG